ncbi:MAG TPA: hypothetical protein VKG44_00250 [Candidatus Baltobacteraceae bacterium]|nr:hypothetical protein [Candidatus Baltobacteraceae bacterium]
MSTWVSGTFSDPQDADDAIDQIIALGYKRDDINVIMSNETRGRWFGENRTADRESNVAKGVASGSLIGGSIGAIVAAFALTGAVGVTAATGGLAAPFVAGPLAAALAGAGAGAATGAGIGALVGAGIPTAEKDRIARDVEGGNIVVGLKAHDEDVPELRGILNAGYESAGSERTFGSSARNL